MTRQWRKEKQSELPKPGFVWTYEHYLTLIFHTLCRGGVLLSGVRTSENQITPGAHLYTPVHHQWTNSVLCVTIPSSTSRRPRRDMPQLEPKYNLKATIPSNSC